jgi:hypothetical protein
MKNLSIPEVNNIAPIYKLILKQNEKFMIEVFNNAKRNTLNA